MLFLLKCISFFLQQVASLKEGIYEFKPIPFPALKYRMFDIQLTTSSMLLLDAIVHVKIN